MPIIPAGKLKVIVLSAGRTVKTISVSPVSGSVVY